MIRLNITSLSVVCLAALLGSAHAGTLDNVRKAGVLKCGVVFAGEDWNKADLHGNLAPLSIEICKAVSITALGDKAKVDITPFNDELSAKEGVSKSKVDLVVGVSPDASGMWQWHIRFGPPVFYDSQAILLRADDNAQSMKDLNGRAVCVIEGTDNEKILFARLDALKVARVSMPFQEEGEMDDGLAVRHCDAVSAYVSRLAMLKAAYPKQIGRDRILPDRLTLSPVTPAYRQDDAQWGMIVDWTIYALIQAEASGITQANVGEQTGNEDVIAQRLLGQDFAASRALGLDDHFWAQKVISVVGNYGEIYDRTEGLHGVLGLERGLNALWTEGGLMHPVAVQ